MSRDCLQLAFYGEARCGTDLRVFGTFDRDSIEVDCVLAKQLNVQCNGRITSP